VSFIGPFDFGHILHGSGALSSLFCSHCRIFGQGLFPVIGDAAQARVEKPTFYTPWGIKSHPFLQHFFDREPP
jgi:hypothetical protein